ncbi:hypothetical protein EC973_005405 [Apophysomyces ossiformis]|uniref:Uncharacterized protein n=1 Tax=Apophysomyces ossiformis TaxID=679940 RepID=A0A8H7BF22_9FUNG|nr:hypothetical protein EC973_005405 [Apophysomyces ossiformis]
MVTCAPASMGNSEIEAAEINSAGQVIPLEISENFQPFNWKNEESETTVDRTFTIDLAEPAQLQITDYKMGGDQFEVLDNGKSLGKTSEAVASTESAFAGTAEEALQDEHFSQGVFPLEAGKHEITIRVADTPYEVGSGALRVVQQLQALYHKKGSKHKKGKGGWKDHDDDDWGKKGKWDDDDDWGHKGKWDDDDDDDDWGHKGWKGKGKDGWKDDDDDWGHKGKWDDDDDDDWGKKGKWDDDDDWGKKGKWDDDEDWGKKGKWDDDEDWGHKGWKGKGGWKDEDDDDWGHKDWDHKDWDHKDWDHKGWDNKKWDDKKTVYVYYTVPSPVTTTVISEHTEHPGHPTPVYHPYIHPQRVPTITLTSTTGTTTVYETFTNYK